MPTLQILAPATAHAVAEFGAERYRTSGGTDADRGIEITHSALVPLQMAVEDGEVFDVVMVPEPILEELALQQMVRPETSVSYGRAVVGCCVQGAIKSPAPFTAEEDFRQWVLSCRQLIMTDPAFTLCGKLVLSLLRKLGIYDEVASRIVVYPAGVIASAAVTDAGPGAGGLLWLPEIRMNKALNLVAAVPSTLLAPVRHVAVETSRSRNSPGAARFLGIINSPECQARAHEAGYAP